MLKYIYCFGVISHASYVDFLNFPQHENTVLCIHEFTKSGTLNYMTDENEPLLPEEDCKTPAERWTAAQIHAKREIFNLNYAYPGRWFTKDELDHVVFSTLDSLVLRGLLETKYSEVNSRVRYFRAVGKWMKEMYDEELKKKRN